MEIIRKYQEQLLAQTPFLQADNDYHKAIKEAFLKTPRHLFVTRFKDVEGSVWNTVTEETLPSLLPLLYANRPLSLYDGPGTDFVSTISQPFIVLRMLELLELEPGNTVFEIGAASGWNAALMGALVGEEGHVYSAEILPEMTALATQNIAKQGIQNVSILQSDGGLGYADKAPYDRIVFTAGATDLPACFFQQLKEGGILLMVLRHPGGGDVLLQLKKAGDHFESVKSYGCEFVRLTGQHESMISYPILPEQLPEWEQLAQQEISETGFWWGGHPELPINIKTAGFRAFLGITEPRILLFKTSENGIGLGYFGLMNDERNALTIARDNVLITYGNEQSRQAFMTKLRSWVELGMPGITSFRLTIYPADKAITPSDKQWIVKRNDSQFVWGL